MSTFPRWKSIVLFFAVVIGMIYALPNLYGEDPAVQVSPVGETKITEDLEQNIIKILTDNDFAYKSIQSNNKFILIRMLDTPTQLKAKDVVKASLGDSYSVAINLAPVTPKWLQALGASPIKLGLDLRGGVRFLLEVDLESSLKRQLEGDYSDLRNDFRENKIRYSQFSKRDKETLVAVFADKSVRDTAYNFIQQRYPHLEAIRDEVSGLPDIELRLSARHIVESRNHIVEQTIVTLRNRVNELGVAEAIVQRQGAKRVVVELPGIQDTARAKNIIGKVATLDFVMVEEGADIAAAMQGKLPPGTRLLYERHGRPVVLKKKVILTGESITGASSAYRDNRPVVNVRLGGGGIALFKDTTMRNVGKAMAVIYREVKVKERFVDGKIVRENKTTEDVISVATINSALGSSFQISGLSETEARDLSLLLRSGSLPATVSIVEETIIGPSMGQENIEKGVFSVALGLGLVLVFMAIYYSVFGLIANVALVLNLMLLLAVMSLLGATLTLPGIAGIVLTLGMAVDANVLIFERIREELRLGLSPQASVSRGFEHAFSTIVDSNLTTLIVGIILYAIGTGPVKGFAVTLCIGIVTSMFTAITGTRALIHYLYSCTGLKRIMVGI